MLSKQQFIPAEQIARWFINRVDRSAGDAITHLKLQKLIYYAQAWFLANFNRPIFKEDLEAWAHGPAHRKLYSKYKNYGWDALPEESGPLPPDQVCKFLEAVYGEYGQYSAKRLEKLTHSELPWQEARGDLAPEAASKNKISQLTMRNFYGGRIGKKEASKIQN